MNFYFSETSEQEAAGNAVVNDLPITGQDASSSTFCNTVKDSVSNVFDSIFSKNAVSCLIE